MQYHEFILRLEGLFLLPYDSPMKSAGKEKRSGDEKMTFMDDDIEHIDGYEQLGQNVIDQAVINNSQILVPSVGEQLNAQPTVGLAATEYSIEEKYRSTFSAAKSSDEHDALVEIFNAELAAKQATLPKFGMDENGTPLSGSYLFNRIKSGNFSANPDLAKIFMDKVQYNFKKNIGPTNPAFIDAILSYQDIAYGLHLEYNPNGILWRTNAAGIPTNRDLNNYFEQQREIEDATNRTMEEMQPLLNTSKGSTTWEEEAKYAIKNGKLYASAGMSDMNPYAGGDGESKVGAANRSKAVEYALKYANDKSDHDGYHYFSQATNDGSDCANYVSQCLQAGGVPMNNGDPTNPLKWYWEGIYHDGLRGLLGRQTVVASASWLEPNALVEYFLQPQNSYGISKISSVDEISNIAGSVMPGDIIGFNNTGEGQPKGYINHVGIVSRVVDGVIYFCGHSNSRNDEPLQEVLKEGDGYQGNIYFIHVKYK